MIIGFWIGMIAIIKTRNAILLLSVSSLIRIVYIPINVDMSDLEFVSDQWDKIFLLSNPELSCTIIFTFDGIQIMLIPIRNLSFRGDAEYNLFQLVFVMCKI